MAASLKGSFKMATFPLCRTKIILGIFRKFFKYICLKCSDFLYAYKQ